MKFVGFGFFFFKLVFNCKIKVFIFNFWYFIIGLLVGYLNFFSVWRFILVILGIFLEDKMIKLFIVILIREIWMWSFGLIFLF